MDFHLGLVCACLLTLANGHNAPPNPGFLNCGFNLTATCDDHMELFVDGNLLATSDSWKITSDVHVPANSREIEIRCTDSWIHGGILASSDNGLITDGEWICSSDDGNSWTPAYEIGENGVTSTGISEKAKWIWTDRHTWKHTVQQRHTNAVCKITLVASKCPEPTTPPPTTTTPPETTPGFFTLTATCDDKMKLFVDGNLMATSGNWRDASQVAISENAQVVEIHCMDTGTVGGILASSDNGLLSDGAWSCSSDNGQNWNPAYEVGPNGRSVPDISPEAKWIWAGGCIGDWIWKYAGRIHKNSIICKIDLVDESPSGDCQILDKEQVDWLKAGLIYGELDGVKVFNNSSNSANISDKNAERDPNLLWPNNILYYSFDTSVTSSQRNMIRSVLRDLKKKLNSCITFEERNTGNRVIVRAGGCCCQSSVGYRGRLQYLSLANGCWSVGTIEHEFLHAIGIWHTQMRSDRDDHVKIIWENIIEDKKDPNFNIYDEARINHHGLTYDYSSIMHYSRYAFQKKWGQTTIWTFDVSNRNVIGQKNGASSGDIALVQRTYGCQLTDYEETEPIYLDGGFWGEWGSVERCNYPAFVTGMELKFESYQGSDDDEDDTALNGVRLTCSDGRTISSSVGKWGQWLGISRCSTGEYIYSASIRKEGKVSDNTAANGVRFRCTDGGYRYPFDGFWGEFSSWYSCPSGSAVMGIQTQLQKPSRGDDTALNDVKLYCAKINSAVHGGWSSWSNYGVCSATCGISTKRRTRACTNPAPSHGGKDCSGSIEETTNCNLIPCAVDGGWSNWSNYGACSATCGISTKRRTRKCTNPAPSHGGRDCSSSNEQTINCNQPACAVEGKDCSETMVKKSGIWGTDTRTMQATLKIPLRENLNSGKNGFKMKLQTDIKLTEFVFWWGVEITPSSGNSFTITPSSWFQGKTSGDVLEHSFQISWMSSDSWVAPEFTSVTINGRDVCSSGPVNGGWTIFGACSVSCGGGTETRTCTDPPPSNNGDDCIGRKIQACNSAQCPGTHPPTDSPVPMTTAPTLPQGDCTESMVMKSAIWGSDTKTMQATLKITLSDDLKSGKDGFKIQLQTDINLTNFVFWWGVEVTPSSGNSFTITPFSTFQGKKSGDILEYSFQISWLSSESSDSPKFTSLVINGHNKCGSA